MNRILIILTFIFSFVTSYAQPETNRSSTAITVVDGNLFAKNSFRPAVFSDTTAANAVTTLDSCGKQIFTYADNRYWLRACSPKRWLRVLREGDAGGADSSIFATRYYVDSSTSVLDHNIFVEYVIEYTHSGAGVTTYQNDTLIGAQITETFIGTYRVGLTPGDEVYISGFDPVTGTITLTNGRIVATDRLRITVRVLAILLRDSNGRPILDGNGNFILLN